MSDWTHITGTVTVKPMGGTQAQKQYVLKTVLEHLPPVTGLDGGMRTHIVMRGGYDGSSNFNEFMESLGGDRWVKLQTQYIVVCEGDLCGRTFEQTKKELLRWLCRLAKRASVCGVLIRLTGFEKELLISDSEPFSEMEETSCPWAEYLLWDRGKSGLPVKLEQKYLKGEEEE